MACSPPGCSVHGILQARTLEWVAIPFSRGIFLTRGWTHISCTGRQILYHWATWEAPSVIYQGPIMCQTSSRILTTTLRGGCCCPHFTDEVTKAWKALWLPQGPTDNKWQSQNSETSSFFPLNPYEAGCWVTPGHSRFLCLAVAQTRVSRQVGWICGSAS